MFRGARGGRDGVRCSRIQGERGEGCQGVQGEGEEEYSGVQEEGRLGSQGHKGRGECLGVQGKGGWSGRDTI